MPDFRIAFQGGGANFITLLGAAKAVYDLHSDEDVDFTINMLAGTSAGSIVAAILATNLDPEIVRNHLKNNGKQRLNRIVKIPKKSRVFPTALAWGKKAGLMAAGNPFLNYDDLKEFISEILGLKGVPHDAPLANVSIPLLATTTDLKRGRVKHWDSQSNDDRNNRLNSVIADSCALPGIFKSLLRSGEARFIDGGLVENLPLSTLADGFSPHRVIGITFSADDDVPLGSIPDYLGAIVSAVIGSNVHNSARAIPPENLIELPREFGTLSFADALERGLDHLYDKVKMSTDATLRRLIHREELRNFKDLSRSKFSRNYDAGRSAEEIYNLFRPPTVEIIELEVEWTLDSLRDPLDVAHSAVNPMVSRYVVKKPAEEKCLVFRISLFSPTDQVSLTSNEIDVSDDSGTSLNFTPLIGTPRKFAKTFSIPVYLYIDVADLPDDCEAIIIRHTDYVPDDLPTFLSPNSANIADRENVGMSCTYDHYEKITWIVHMPEIVHNLCAFAPLRELDEDVSAVRFVEGNLIENYTGDKNRPLNFVTIKWQSAQTARKDEAAGFQILDKHKVSYERAAPHGDRVY